MTDRETLLEAAALAALDVLPAAARPALEAGLRDSPELAAEAGELAGAAALLAFAANPRPVPTTTWAHIAARLVPEAPAVRVIPFPRRLRGLVANGWAVAASLVLGWAVHLWWSATGGPTPAAAERLPNSGLVTTDGAAAASVQQPPVSAHLPATGAGTSPSPVQPGMTRDTEMLLESRRLQAEVRLLSTEVAELSRQIEEAAILPPATMPLQVFQLGPTNFAGDGGMWVLRPRSTSDTEPTGGQAALLTEALALAAARSLAATPAEPAADNAPVSAIGSVPPATGDQEQLWTALTREVTAIGFASPATGDGAVVVHFAEDSRPPAGSIVTVSQAGRSGDPVAVLASGTTTDSATTVITFSASDTASLTGSGAGGFIVTVQPPATTPPPVDQPVP